MRRSVIRHHVNSWIDPGVVFSALYAEQPNCFWLDSGIHALTGMSYLGSGSRVVTSSVAGGVVTVQPGAEVRPGSVFDFLAAELAGYGRQYRAGRHPAVPASDPASSSAGWPDGFELGWVGWLGYELRHQSVESRLADSAAAPPESARHPDAALLFADRMIAFDHARRKVTLLALGEQWGGALRKWRDEILELLEGVRRESSRVSSAILGRPPTAPSPRSGSANPVHAAGLARHPVTGGSPVPPASQQEPGGTVRWRDSDQEYLAMIRACQAEIRAGNAYQLCLTTQATVDAHPDPAAAYAVLRAASPSPHGGFLRIGGVCLLSSSPERFLSVSEDGVIESKPIKGTRRRGSSPVEDAQLRAELAASDKETAENLMIVDLMRNDIGRVSVAGSVSVPTLLEVESYAQVHQLVSAVRGRLADGLTGVDAVVACFPAGSMTGAPKLGATEILHRLERHPRGIYSGAFGFFGLNGAVELAMVIRSIVLDEEGATVGAGGGITALSIPQEELEEVRLKAAALIAVLATDPPS